MSGQGHTEASTHIYARPCGDWGETGSLEKAPVYLQDMIACVVGRDQRI
jgi:hypothetical protein